MVKTSKKLNEIKYDFVTTHLHACPAKAQVYKKYQALTNVDAKIHYVFRIDANNTNRILAAMNFTGQNLMHFFETTRLSRANFKKTLARQV